MFRRVTPISEVDSRRFATTRKSSTPLQPGDHYQETGHNQMRSGHHPFHIVFGRSRPDGHVYPAGLDN